MKCEVVNIYHQRQFESLPDHRMIFFPHPSKSTLTMKNINQNPQKLHTIKLGKNITTVNGHLVPHKLVEPLETYVLHPHHLYLCLDEASLQAFKRKEP